MKIITHKHFDKHVQKLGAKQRNQIIRARQIFEADPCDPRLKNHPLHGPLTGLRAFSVNADLRIVFREYDDYVIVLFMDVGTHAQLYE